MTLHENNTLKIWRLEREHNKEQSVSRVEIFINQSLSLNHSVKIFIIKNNSAHPLAEKTKGQAQETMKKGRTILTITKKSL